MTKRTSLALITGSALVALAGCAAQVAAPPARPWGSAAITAADLFARIEFLASDALAGRDTPSPGLEAAAAYIVSEYRQMGLDPAGENGTYYQRYPFAQWSLDTTTVHFGTVAEGMRDNRMLTYGDDFFVTAASTAAGVDMGHAELVWVGVLGPEGLPAGEYRHRAPVVSIEARPGRDWRMAVARARRAAQEAGATALVAVVAPDFPEQTFRQLAAQSRRPQRGVPSGDEIAVIHLTHGAAETIARRSNLALASLASAPARAPVPFAGISAHFAANRVVAAQLDPPNVAAVLRGSDPALRDEYVVLSAHMDHDGIGPAVNGDSIYNGADDNASGTAGLLEIAQALASLPEAERPRRSIIFLHVSGEEKGLLGSRWFADHPTVPVERIVANVNVDMIARNAPDTVVVIGKNYSSLGPLVERVNAARPELGLVAADDKWPEERFFFRSDHFNFARREIPAIFFFTGVHEDYHRPSDTVEKLDVRKAERVSRLIYHVVREIANERQRPTWVPEGLAEVRAMTR